MNLVFTIHLYLDVMELAVKLFKFQKFPNEKVAITVGHLRIGDVDHIIVDVKVQLKKKDNINVCHNRQK